MKAEWFVVVNPIAGNGKGAKDWQQISILLDKAGLLDVSVIGKLGKLKIIKSIKKLYDGSFVQLKEVETFTCKHLIVESDPLFRMEADGESIPPSVYDIQILEKALSVVLP